jgi:hypothetical protein
VAYCEGSLGCSCHRPAVQQHLLQQDLTGILHAQGDHGQTVADQYHVHTGVVGNVGAREVVGGDHGNGFILAVEALEGVDGNGLAGIGWRQAQW